MVDVGWAGGDYCEAVVGWGDARGLNATTEDVVYEGGLSGGMVTDEEDEWKVGSFVAVLLERASYLGVERHDIGM